MNPGVTCWQDVLASEKLYFKFPVFCIISKYVHAPTIKRAYVRIFVCVHVCMWTQFLFSVHGCMSRSGDLRHARRVGSVGQLSPREGTSYQAGRAP